METRKIIDAIDEIKDARGEVALALQLLRWYLTQSVSPPTGGIEGGSVSWSSLLKFAQKQALVGVMFEGIQRLPKELSPKGPVLLTWIAQAQMIERQNRKLNAATAAVYRRIKELGEECCILKGQGNALLYQNPLARTPGDVDVWLAPNMKKLKYGNIEILGGEKAQREALRKVAAELTKGHGTIGHESYNHIEMTVDGIPVELHPTPAILNCPLHNRRLQRWLEDNAQAQCANRVGLPDGCGQIAIPTREFNLVYQLLHLYHHHLFEGIGLRQFVDYLLLVKSEKLKDKRREQAPSSSMVFPPPSFPPLSGDRNPCRGERQSTSGLPPTGGIEGGFGINRFAGAVMYVLHEVFGLAEEDMIVPMDKRRGKLLLHDILRGGNFGHYDHRFAHTALGHNLQRLQRDFLLIRYYPAEALSEPFFRLWHWVWRKRQRM